MREAPTMARNRLVTRHSYRAGVRTRDSGQALVECALSATVMLILIFGLIDLSRAIFVAQVIANLSGQGSSMASRGTTLANTAAAVAASSAPLNLNTSGRVIVSAVFNSNNVMKLTGQSAQGGIAVPIVLDHNSIARPNNSHRRRHDETSPTLLHLHCLHDWDCDRVRWE